MNPRYELTEDEPHKSGRFRIWDAAKACHVCVNPSDGFLQVTTGQSMRHGRFRSRKQAEKFLARCNAGRVTWMPDPGA